MNVENRKAKAENSPQPAVANGGTRISDFTQLKAWQRARELRRALYQVVKTFPSDEKYGLSSQLKRAASSVTANLAEGYGRYSYQENLQFCRQARGSLYELRDHLTAALDAGYIPQEKYAELEDMAMNAIRLVNGYIRATKILKASAPPKV
jgi:four helix bundle protein